jgi:NADH pyrophosphatase NudC (nudix superfamily)
MTAQFCSACGAALETRNIDGVDRLACTKCPHVHYLPPNPVAIAIIPHRDGLVLIKRKYGHRKGYYAFVSGFVEANEDPGLAAVREALEEAGLTLEVDRFLGYRMPDDRNELLMIFLMKATDATPIGGDDAEEAIVFSLDKLPAGLAYPTHDEALALYLSGEWR